MSSKDGRDNPTPAMPPNLLVNPFAPQAKKRTKPSAKQRAKNRAARAASQQSPPAQVVPQLRRWKSKSQWNQKLQIFCWNWLKVLLPVQLMTYSPIRTFFFLNGDFFIQL